MGQSRVSMASCIRQLGFDVWTLDRMTRRLAIEHLSTKEIAREMGICEDVAGVMLRLAFGCRFERGRGVTGTHGYVLVPDLIIRSRTTAAKDVYAVARRDSFRVRFFQGPRNECVLWLRHNYGVHAYKSRWELGKELMSMWRARRAMVVRLLSPKHADERVAELQRCDRALVDILREKYGVRPAFEAEVLTA